ncbi:F-box protein At5g03100 [Linum grandiflorum]
MRKPAAAVSPVTVVVQNDRISLLPDDILHCILRRLTSKQAAQTSTLSRRWRSLWQSYPFVEFGDEYCNHRDLQNFAAATIRKFSQDSLQAMAKMTLLVPAWDDTVSPSVVQLLKLASNRKAAEVYVSTPSSYSFGYLRFPLESLSNSSFTTLWLSNLFIVLTDEDCDFLSLNSLRFLRLTRIDITDRVLTKLIASCPLLETLEFHTIGQLKRIHVSKVDKLKMLTISDVFARCEEIEIVAPGLETLDLRNIGKVSRIDLTAPQLNHLKITNHSLSLGYIAAMINSNLQSLESLTLSTSLHERKLKLCNPKLEKFNLQPLKSLTLSTPPLESDRKLKLWSPNLEKFDLRAPTGLEEIELDCGPRFTNFTLRFDDRSAAYRLSKCEIRNAAAALIWKVDFKMDHCPPGDHDDASRWFFGLKNFLFLARFSYKFITITLPCSYLEFTPKEDEADHGAVSVHPEEIKHLKIESTLFRFADQDVVVDCLFRTCHPKYLTVFSGNIWIPKKFIQTFLSQYTGGSLMKNNIEEYTENRHSWQQQLKDVKIIKRDVDRDIEKDEEVEEEGSTIVSEEAAIAMLEARTRVCFKLTWY